MLLPHYKIPTLFVRAPSGCILKMNSSEFSKVEKLGYTQLATDGATKQEHQTSSSLSKEQIQQLSKAELLEYASKNFNTIISETMSRTKIRKEVLELAFPNGDE